MPFTRHSAPIDHFRCFLGDHTDKRFKEYMTFPASWTATEAHAAIDEAHPCDKRPYRTAWQYEAEIHNLKGQLDAIAKERNEAQAKAAHLEKSDAERIDAWARELAGILGIEPRRWTCDAITGAVRTQSNELLRLQAGIGRGELLAKKHDTLDPQYGAAAERAKREQVERELKHIEGKLQEYREKDEKEQALGRIIADIVSPGSHAMHRDALIARVRTMRDEHQWRGDELKGWGLVSEFIQSNRALLPDARAGKSYFTIAYHIIEMVARGKLRTDEAQAAMQQDNENLKKMVDDWRVKSAKAERFEAELTYEKGRRVDDRRRYHDLEVHFEKLKQEKQQTTTYLHRLIAFILHADPNVGVLITEDLMQAHKRVEHLITVEKAWAKRLFPTTTPEQDQKVGAALRELEALSSAQYALAIVGLVTAMFDARGYGDGH